MDILEEEIKKIHNEILVQRYKKIMRKHPEALFPLMKGDSTQGLTPLSSVSIKNNPHNPVVMFKNGLPVYKYKQEEFPFSYHILTSEKPVQSYKSKSTDFKQFYILNIADSSFRRENPDVSLHNLHWRVRSSPQRLPNNTEFSFIHGTIAEIVSVEGVWLELKNGWALYKDVAHNNEIMWQEITNWASEFQEFDRIIPGCYDRVKFTLLQNEPFLCTERNDFVANIAGILINQFGCTIFGGFVRDFIFSNEEVIDLDVRIPGTSFHSFIDSFSSFCQAFGMSFSVTAAGNDLTKATLIRDQFTLDIDFVITDGFSGGATVDFDVNNFQLTTFGRNNEPILFQRAAILKSNQEVVESIRNKVCAIIENDKFRTNRRYTTYFKEQRVPKMLSKGWKVSNQNMLTKFL